MENEVLQGLAWDPAAGTLTFRGIRYMLVRPETVVVFQQAVEAELGPAAGALMFAGGKAGGGATARMLHHQSGLPAPAVAEAMCRMGTQLGWGAFRVLEAGAAGLTVAVGNSAYARAYGAAAAPVCHFIRGVFAGVAEIVLGSPVADAEATCTACGGAVCRFVYRPLRS